MDKINLNPVFTKIILLLLFIFITIITFILTSNKQSNLYNQILDFSKNNQKIILSELTDFDWDVAYIDRQYYHKGEYLKEKYHIEGDFQLLETDFSSRIAFCKNNKLVYDMILNNFYFEIDDTIKIINPKDSLKIKWIITKGQKEKKLLLLPNN